MKKSKLFMALDTGIGKFLHSISFRLMLFNIILVFLPVASILYLDTYEKQLLESQEKSMVQQGRLLSAALSNSGNLDIGKAKRILINLNRRTEARLRILDENGMLLADSSTVFQTEIQSTELLYSEPAIRTKINRESFLYRSAIWPVRIYRKIFKPPVPVAGESFYKSYLPFNGIEVKAALDGRYGAVTRISSDGLRSVRLYIAIPVMDGKNVIATVLCSQSSYRILQNLYEIRIVLLKIFLLSLLVALVISLLLSLSISSRIKRLRNDAEKIRTGRGRLVGSFTPLKLMDEIGELSLSLDELTIRLDRHIRYTATFIEDFSHEFKNPLSVLRTASEMMQDATADQRHRFIRLIAQNTVRMELLLDGIRELSLIDKDLEEELKDPVDIKTLLDNLISGFKVKYPSRVWHFDSISGNINVIGTENKLGRVFINIMENANSFGLEGSPVEIILESIKDSNELVISISNTGKHITDSDLKKIFNRFYSNRDKNQGKHNGLGLSIARTIIKSYSGRIKAKNTDQGVCFEIILPLYFKKK